VMRRTGILATLGEDRLWHTISAGVRQARKVHGIKGWAEPDSADDDRAEVVRHGGHDDAEPADSDLDEDPATAARRG
jgi:hypothetical protein